MSNTTTAARLVRTNRDGKFSDFNVETVVDGALVTIGRISGSAGAWNALPIGATAWSRWHRTRDLALVALVARENFLLPETHIPTVVR
jgi:hypothetical protein